MEKGLYRPEFGTVMAALQIESVAATVETDWRQSLPVLTNGNVTLRELELGDAPSLLAMLTTKKLHGLFLLRPRRRTASSASSRGRISSARPVSTPVSR